MTLNGSASLLRMRPNSADQAVMEAHYRVGDVIAGRPFWNASAARSPAWQLQLPGTLITALSLWRESGLVAALLTLAALPPLLVLIYFRALRLEVFAHANGVRVANWFSNHQWSWKEIRSVDYARPLVPRLYKGRVILRSGRTYVLSAVVGSASGRIEKDIKPRAFIDQLRTMLDAAQAPAL